MADEISEAFKVEAKLKQGLFGTFDIIVDGRPVFSKSQIGRFPDKGEVVEIIKGMQASTPN